MMGFMIAIVHSHGFLMGETTGMMTRITMTSAIFSKVGLGNIPGLSPSHEVLKILLKMLAVVNMSGDSTNCNY